MGFSLDWKWVPLDNINAKEKEMFFYAIAVSLVSMVATIHGVFKEMPLLYGGSGFILLTTAVAIVMRLQGQTITTWVLQCLALCYTFGILLVDLNQASSGNVRLWVLCVLVADMLLVFGAPHVLTRFVVFIVCLWIIVTQLEFALRFGLFDVAGTVGDDVRKQHMFCEHPPCKRSLATALVGIVPMTMVFFLDFCITRSFANALRKEHLQMKCAVAQATSLAKALAHFELDAAEELLNSEGTPEELQAAFATVVHNLYQYRPFLPDSLFDELHATSVQRSLAVAGPVAPPESPLAIVFTDIVSSTRVWAAVPQAMKSAMRVHNTAIRYCIKEHGGYEVKTNGDSFMVAFPEASDAMRFSLAVLKELHSSSWPPALLQVPECRRDENGLWGGLTVRVGMNYGDVSAELNELTGRMDYFGMMVNQASRLEGIAPAGSVAVSDSVLHLCHGHERSCSASPPMSVHLKGIAPEQSVRHVWPKCLEGRAHNPHNCHLGDSCGSEATTFTFSCSNSSLSRSESILHAFAETSWAGTIAAVFMNNMSERNPLDFQPALQSLIMCADRSEGQVYSVLGSAVTLAWNTTMQGCKSNHAENAIHFALLLQRRLDFTTIGIATGNVVCGSVGSAKTRFMTVLGAPVTISWKLVRQAEDRDVSCMFTVLDESKKLSRTINAGLRPGGVLDSHTTYELLPELVLTNEGTWDDNESTGSGSDHEALQLADLPQENTA